MLRFGPRVKGIGQYPAHIHAFLSSGEQWSDLGQEEPGEASLGRAGLEWVDHEGERNLLLFKHKEEVQQLLDELQHAQNIQQPVIEYQGVKLPVRSELLEDLNNLLWKLRSQGGKKDKRKAEQQRRGVLIYENIEKEEYSEGVPNERVSFQSNFVRPGMLLPDVTLKEHQVDGIGWLQQSLQREGTKGVLLADDMGLGKTLQVLTFLAWAIESRLKETLGRDAAPYNPILIVAPLILIDEVGWRAELNRFFKTSHFMPYQVLYGKELKQLRLEQGTEAALSRPLLNIDAIRRNRLVITNYETVANYALTFSTIPWSIVIADEAHTFKDPNTRIAYAMKALKTNFRVAMTGTPIQNRLLDLWNLVDFLQPGPLLGSAKEFQAQYERRPVGDEEARQATARLRQRLRIGRHDAVLLRRTKEEHLSGLPQKRERVIPCPLTSLQRKLHISFIQQAQANEGGSSAFSLLSSLNKLCQHPALLNEGLVADDPSALIAASQKLQAVLNQLREIRRRKEKALIFAWFRDAQEILRRTIESEFKLDVHILNGQAQGAGSKMLAARTRMIRDFEEQVGFNVLILSPEVAGVGLTIVKANHVLHYGRWWNPAVEDQATDRVYRIGQERDVEVYYFIATDPLKRFTTFDEHLHSLISRKRRNARDFLEPQDDTETLQSELLRKVQADAAAGNEVAIAPPIHTPQAVAALSPSEFEALVAAMFTAEGYKTILTPYAHDRGIDVIGIRNAEVLFVQCKHSQDGRSFERTAIDEVAYGETYYTPNLLPSTLRKHRPRLTVVANGEGDSQAYREAEQRGVQLFSGRSLFQRLTEAQVTRALLDQMEGQRANSLNEVKARLQEIALQIFS
ncbi:MAG TPA: SNF2-related protein [Methylomirabilota bacterium]|nr:SNF2-related protein [Methylomirabilota bacterium]